MTKEYDTGDRFYYQWKKSKRVLEGSVLCFIFIVIILQRNIAEKYKYNICKQISHNTLIFGKQNDNQAFKKFQTNTKTKPNNNDVIWTSIWDCNVRHFSNS